MRNTGRTGSTALALVVALGIGFIVGMASAPADASDRGHSRSAAILDVVAGDYSPGRTELADTEVGALLDVYAVEESTGAPCYSAVAELLATRDYVPAMAPCLGEEDSPAVAVILG